MIKRGQGAIVVVILLCLNHTLAYSGYDPEGFVVLSDQRDIELPKEITTKTGFTPCSKILRDRFYPDKNRLKEAKLNYSKSLKEFLNLKYNDAINHLSSTLKLATEAGADGFYIYKNSLVLLIKIYLMQHREIDALSAAYLLSILDGKDVWENTNLSPEERRTIFLLWQDRLSELRLSPILKNPGEFKLFIFGKIRIYPSSKMPSGYILPIMAYTENGDIIMKKVTVGHNHVIFDNLDKILTGGRLVCLLNRFPDKRAISDLERREIRSFYWLQDSRHLDLYSTRSKRLLERADLSKDSKKATTGFGAIAAITSFIVSAIVLIGVVFIPDKNRVGIIVKHPE